MALCRCLEKHKWPKGINKEYIAYVKPIGYPNTALICGRKGCENPAVIWLERNDIKNYHEGQRIFKGQTNVLKMKADDGEIIEKTNN